MWLMSPLSWLLFAVLLVCFAAWSKCRRRGLLLAGALIAAVSFFAMTPLFANLLLVGLEDGYEIPHGCRVLPPETAVVLGGGVSGRASGPDDFSVLGLASRRRVDRAVAWERADGRRRLVMSGGSWLGDGVPESRLMDSYARRFGVPGAAISEEGTSLTTWQSAQHLARLQPPLPRRVVLITSAAHMPRAQYAMAAAGFTVCPLAADRRYIPLQMPGYLIPQRSALEKTEQGLHEIVGLLYYRWLAYAASRHGHGGNG